MRGTAGKVETDEAAGRAGTGVTTVADGRRATSVPCIGAKMVEAGVVVGMIVTDDETMPCC